MKKFLLLFCLILAIVVRLYLLDSLPGEWFGDISNVHEYVTEIMTGKWPFYFFQSSGPLYPYIISPVVILFHNLGYETYKIASVFVSLLSLFSIYLLANEISRFRVAIVTLLISGYSYVLLIWSRLGNSQIAIPLLSSLVGFFLIRFFKKGKFKDVISGAFVSSLGWYLYPQTFILPLAFLVPFLLFLFFKKEKIKLKLAKSLLIIATLVILVLPFVKIVNSQPSNFGLKGYVGEKVLPAFKMNLFEITSKTARRYIKILGMFHINSDDSFRTNISGHPHLDFISGLFMLLGLVYFFKTKGWRLTFFIVFTMLILALPSISPILLEGEIPNSGRTLAMMPYVYLLVAAGIFWLSHKLKSLNNYLKVLVTSLLIVFIAYLNIKLYFTDYANGLPNRNTPYGKIIAEEIDKQPKNTIMVLISCCWGDYGQPEPKAIINELRTERNLYFYKAHNNQKDFTCSDLENKGITDKPILFVIDPNNLTTRDKVRECLDSGRQEMLVKNGFEIAWIYKVGLDD